MQLSPAFRSIQNSFAPVSAVNFGGGIPLLEGLTEEKPNLKYRVSDFLKGPGIVAEKPLEVEKCFFHKQSFLLRIYDERKIQSYILEAIFKLDS